MVFISVDMQEHTLLIKSTCSAPLLIRFIDLIPHTDQFAAPTGLKFQLTRICDLDLVSIWCLKPYEWHMNSNQRIDRALSKTPVSPHLRYVQKVS